MSAKPTFDQLLEDYENVLDLYERALAQCVISEKAHNAKLLRNSYEEEFFQILRVELRGGRYDFNSETGELTFRMGDE